MGRFEVWTDWGYAGGTRLAVINDWIRGQAEVTEDIEGEDKLTLPMSRLDDSWPHVEPRRVVRWVDPDQTPEYVREWRIRDVVERVTDGGEELAELVCEGPIYDLAHRGKLLRRTEANGRTDGFFQANRRLPSTHMDILLGTLSPYTPSAPSHFVKGTVEPTDRVDMTYDWDTRLSAWRELRQVVHGEAEIDLRRDDGQGAFALDLVREIGAGSPKPLIQVGRNAASIRRVESTKDQATVVSPRGGGSEGERASIARHRFEVTATGPPTIDPDLVLEDDQFNGLYLLHLESGELRQITDTTASSGALSVASGFTSLAVGDHVRIVENANGDQLLDVSLPSAVNAWGEVPKRIDRQDIPNVNNLLDNAYLIDWTGGTPDDWDVLGAASVTQYTGDQFAGHGGSSAHVIANEGDGIGTQSTFVSPDADSPYFTGQVRLWLVSGSVRIRMIDVTNSAVWPPGDADTDEITDETGTWVETLGIQPGEDFHKSQTSELKLHIVAMEPGTEFYLDAGMLTQTPGGVRFYYDKSAGEELWRAALDHLAVFAEPLDTIEVDFVSLHEVDSVGYREVVKGGTARIRVPEFGLDIERRVKGITWHPGVPYATTLEIETQRERLSRQLAASKRRRRAIKEQRDPQASRPDNVQNFTGVFTDILVLRWDAAVGASRYEIRRQGFGSSPLDRWENGTPFGSTDATNFVEESPAEASLDLTIRAVNAWGRWSLLPTELTITSTGSGGPCENLVKNNPAAEHCSTVTNTDELIHTYPTIDLAQHGLEPGDLVSYAFEGKVGSLPGGILAQSQFSESEICQLPTGWQKDWQMQDAMVAVGAVGARPVLWMDHGGPGIGAMRFTDAGVIDASVDGPVEVLCLFYHEETGGLHGIIASASGAGPPRDGVILRNNNNSIKLCRIGGSCEDVIANTPGESWLWYRLRVDGNGDAVGKVWEFGQSEPGAWMATLPGAPTSGWVGTIFDASGGINAFAAMMAVAIDGETAGFPPEPLSVFIEDFASETPATNLVAPPSSLELMGPDPLSGYEEFRAVADAGATGGIIIREDCQQGGVARDRPHRFYRIPGVISMDTNTRAKVRVESLGSEVGVFVRGGGGKPAGCGIGGTLDGTMAGTVAYITGGDTLVVEQYHLSVWSSTLNRKQVSFTLPTTYAINEWVWVEAEFVGATLRAKAWRDGDPEPSSWQIEETWDMSGTGNTGRHQSVRGATGWYVRQNTAGPVELDVIETTVGLSGATTLPSIHATVEIEVLDSDGDVIETETPVGVSSLTYIRGAGTIELPANAAALRVSSWKKGAHNDDACVRRVQVNRGRIPCAFQNPTSSSCDNLLGSEGGPERCTSGEVSQGTVFHTWPRITLADHNLSAGDSLAWGWEGKVVSTTPSGSIAFPTVTIKFYDAGGTEIDGFAPLGPQGSTYEHAESSRVIPTNAVEVEFRAVRNGLATSAEVCLKQVQVNPGTTPCAFTTGGGGSSPTSCPNIGPLDAGTEYCSGSTDSPTAYQEYSEEVVLADHGIGVGDSVAWAFEGKVDTSSADVAASVRLTFLDSGGSGLGAHEPPGVKTDFYTRASATAVVPTNAVSMKFEATRQGELDGQNVCVRNLQVNPGTQACRYSSPSTPKALEAAAVANINLDTCAGGTGVEIEVGWKIGSQYTNPPYEMRITYYVDGSPIATATGVDPQAGSDSHTIAGAGSDAGDAASKDVHALVLVGKDETFSTPSGSFTVFSPIDSIQTVAVQETWGTC